jgi:hypothetical protein
MAELMPPVSAATFATFEMTLVAQSGALDWPHQFIYLTSVFHEYTRHIYHMRSLHKQLKRMCSVDRLRTKGVFQ